MATKFKPTAPSSLPVPTHKKLVPKPRLSAAEIERKRNKPPGYCVQAFEDQKRVLENKRIRSENRMGKDGFKRKGIVTDMLFSNEGVVAMAALLVGMNAIGGLARGFGAGLGRLIFRNGKAAAGGGRTRGSHPEIIPVGIMAPAPARGRSRKPKLAMGGGGEDSGTAPVSSRRRDTSTAAAPVPVHAPLVLTPRQKSSNAGDRIRERAGTELGDRLAYDFLVAAIVFKPGHQGGDPREEPNAMERLAKVSPAVAEFIMGTHAGTKEYVELRNELARRAVKLGRTMGNTDKADLGLAYLPYIEDHAKKWVAEQAAAFQQGAPRPQAENENEGGDRDQGARPGMNNPDEPEEFTPPVPAFRGRR